MLRNLSRRNQKRPRGGRRARGGGSGVSAANRKLLPADRPGTLSLSPGLPFPDRLACRLALRTTISITDPDTFSDTVLSGCSLFDPLGASGSTQPVYYDQLATLYGNYVVTRSRCSFRVLATNVSAAAGGNVARTYRCGIAPRDSSSGFSTADDLLSQSRTRGRDVTIPGSSTLVANAADTSRILGLTDVFQVQALSTAAVSCAADTSANPSSEWFWHLCAVDTVGGTNPTISLDVKLEYDCEFFDRQPQAVSFFDRMMKLKAARDEYLKLKALTPGKTGRVPRPSSDPIRAFVEQFSVDRAESKESKTSGVKESGAAGARWILAKVPSKAA